MQSTSSKSARVSGFTLIELSIVLVIIGLIVGGVLAGQDLIRAAEVRATISQIEKFNTATNTFRGKYGALPGDMDNATALQFGFAQRGQYAGEGDGNGVLEGVDADAAGNNGGGKECVGETVMFWVDLTSANGLNLGLIDGNFTTATTHVQLNNDISGTALNLYFPQAKLGHGNYIYAYSGGWSAWFGNPDSTNYFGLSAISTVLATSAGQVVSAPALTVQQAYNIDKKLDDGMPQSGRVMAMFLGVVNNVTWAAGAGAEGAFNSGTNGPTTTATSPSSTTCYDNGGVAGPQQYSLGQNGGSGVNCALSFMFQ